MEDWGTNFGVYIGFEDLTLSKTRFCEISSFPTPSGGKRLKYIFERNWARNYFTMKKFHVRHLGLNTKKLFSATLKFLILRSSKGKNAKFWKIPIFECNLAPNYSTVKKFHERKLDLNLEHHLWRFWNFRFLWLIRKDKRLFWKNWFFEHTLALKY